MRLSNSVLHTPFDLYPSDSLPKGSHTVNSPNGEELPTKELTCQAPSSLWRLCPTQLDSSLLRDPEAESSSHAPHSFLALRNCIINVGWLCVRVVHTCNQSTSEAKFEEKTKQRDSLLLKLSSNVRVSYLFYNLL